MELYFKNLAKTLTVDEAQKTPLSIPGFQTLVSDTDFREYVAEHSYMSFWIDNTTKLPVRAVEVMIIPTHSGKVNGRLQIVTDVEWTKHNTPVIVKKPTKIISYTEGRKLLGLSSAIETAEIAKLLKALKDAETKDDRASVLYDLATIYNGMEQWDTAAAYYKEAAKNYPKNSADYYEAMASAEWSLGNIKKAISYLEQGYKKHPKDLLIASTYGWLLLGITKSTAPYQDLEKALIYNKVIVEGFALDESLLQLYINYLMLGNQTAATALIAQFEELNTPENLNWIARAYYRMGNKVKADEYVKLAKEKGYVRTSSDDAFFGLKF